jgi:uncharacterized protein involved in exopolysaccharide biosynthesis
LKHPASTPKRPARHQSGSVARDVIFVLLALLCLGGAAALVYNKVERSPSYETRAKLLVRYVLDRSVVDSYESKVDSGGNRGMEMIDAELEIIKSADLALEVAGKVGPEKILPSLTEPPTRAEAANQIIRNLKAKSAERSNVIHLSYRHPKPDIAVTVLKQLIDTYFDRHLEIHRSTGAFREVAQQTELARSRLSQTEQELAKLNLTSGVLSLSDGKAALESRRSVLRQSLMESQAQLAEQQAKVASLESSMAAKPPAPPQADDKTADEANPLTQEIAGHEKNQMAGVESPQTQGTDLNVERARLASLEARLKVIIEQSKKLDAEIERISHVGLEFTTLERRRELEEERYRFFESQLEKTRRDEALDPASIPNISVVQNPSSPVRSLDDTTRMIVIGLAACGLLLLLRIALRPKAVGKAEAGPEPVVAPAAPGVSRA